MRHVLALALIAFLAACGGDSSTGPDTSHLGNYTLRTVQGNNVPATIYQAGNDKIELINGFVNINADNSYTAALNYRITESGQVSTYQENSQGTYVRNGNAISFTERTDGSTSTGTLTGSQLSITLDGVALVYSK